MKKQDQFKVISYRYGLFKNHTLEEFLNEIETDEWGVFQVLQDTWWYPGGTEHTLQIVMKRR